MGSKEGSEARKVSVKPGFKGKPGGERRALGTSKVFEKLGEGGAVG